MALIKCRECGREMSDQASACPHCGCPALKIGLDMFQELFTGPKPNTIEIPFTARIQGPESGTTQQAVHVSQLKETFYFNVPNNLQPGHGVRLLGKGQTGANGVRGDILFTAKAVEVIPPMPMFSGQEMDAKVAAFKSKRRMEVLFPVSCLFICAISILVTRITLITYFIIPFLVAFLPAIWGVVKLLGILFGDKSGSSIARLEERGLLGQLLMEMDSGRTVPFGDKASLSDHFLCMNNRRGILLACDDILWVYTRRGNRYENLMLGTKHLGVVTISGQEASLVGVIHKYKEKLMASITELQRRNPAIMVGYSPENRAKYQALRER